MKKVHLGCGKNIIDGWINVDLIKDPSIMFHDLRKPLPFEDNSIDFFFSEHFFEHLSKEDGVSLLKEIYRCLKPGGVSRITVPDLSLLVKLYLDNNIDYYNKVGFRAKTKCELLNGGMRRWEHRYMYDSEELILVHKECGFSFCKILPHKQSNYIELNNLEKRLYSGEISCEGKK